MNPEQNKIKRFFRLDQLLRDSEGHTLKELLQDPFMDDISKRSLQENLKEFEEVFGAEFDLAYRGRERLWKYKDPNYSISNQINRDIEVIHKCILNLKFFQGYPQYDWLRLFLMELKNGVLDIKPFMSFGSNMDLQGLDNIETIGLAIINKHPLKIWYKPFYSEEFVVNVHPYFLKQYNYRWFLLARSEERSDISIFPVDRITQIDYLSKPYIPTDIDFDYYFDDIVGITHKKGSEIEKIVLRINKSGNSIDYIRTKPLHGSQKELHELEDSNFVYVQLEVKINKELQMLLLSYGDAIEVLAPLDFRQQMSDIVSNMNKTYNKV